MLSAVRRSLFFAFASLLFIFASCSPRAETAAEIAARDASEREADEEAASRARELAAAMDDASLAGQVLLTGVDGGAGLAPRSAALLGRLRPGGAMLFRYNLGKGEAAARSLAADIRGASASAAPPFVAVDHEGGPVHRFGADATRLPAAASFGALGPERARRVAEEASYLSGRELRALGVTLNLAPVAEIADDRSIAFLEERAYGRDPVLVAAAAAGFVEGMRRAGVACVVKHFPGNAAADPHHARAVVQADGPELERMLESFSRVFAESRPAAVMVSHAVVAAVDPELPATLSPRVIAGLLREKLGYRGLAVSDDLRMKAIADAGFSPSRAAVAALGAGIDLVMTWPADAELLRDALVAAVAHGQLSRDRLREAAARVLAVKIRYGLLESPPAEEAQPLAELKAATEAYLRAEGLL